MGKPAPAFVTRTLDGGRFDLAALRGKVVLVNFWATWCAPCREEMPALDAFYKENHDRGLEMVGVSVDRPKDVARVNKVMKDYGFPVAMLSATEVDGIGAPEGLPVTYVIDAGGVVRDKLFSVEKKLLREVVSPLLRKARSGAGG
jgi:cytochrome c biogenesis protein CcmG, thiol:disulfide interchange protein DsbE